MGRKKAGGRPGRWSRSGLRSLPRIGRRPLVRPAPRLRSLPRIGQRPLVRPAPRPRSLPWIGQGPLVQPALRPRLLPRIQSCLWETRSLPVPRERPRGPEGGLERRKTAAYRTARKEPERRARALRRPRCGAMCGPAGRRAPRAHGRRRPDWPIPPHPRARAGSHARGGYGPPQAAPRPRRKGPGRTRASAPALRTFRSRRTPGRPPPPLRHADAARPEGSARRRCRPGPGS